MKVDKLLRYFGQYYLSSNYSLEAAKRLLSSNKREQKLKVTFPCLQITVGGLKYCLQIKVIVNQVV